MWSPCVSVYAPTLWAGIKYSAFLLIDLKSQLCCCKVKPDPVFLYFVKLGIKIKG